MTGEIIEDAIGVSVRAAVAGAGGDIVIGGKHTPGPWSAFVVEDTMTVSVDIGPHPSGKRPNVVDWTGFDTCGLPFEEQAANARLIAAAPDLLAALKLAVAQLEAHGFDGLASGASAAIAKASGDVL